MARTDRSADTIKYPMGEALKVAAAGLEHGELSIGAVRDDAARHSSGPM